MFFNFKVYLEVYTNTLIVPILLFTLLKAELFAMGTASVALSVEVDAWVHPRNEIIAKSAYEWLAPFLNLPLVEDLLMRLL